MSKKRPSRYERTFYEEPKKPKAGAKRFRVEVVAHTADRANHFPGTSDDYFYEEEYDDPENIPENTGKINKSHTISLKKINELVKQDGLDEKNVFFTASFSDDYLALEVVHIQKLNDQEIEEDYQWQLVKWKNQQSQRKEYELQRIEDQMASLKRQAEELQK